MAEELDPRLVGALSRVFARNPTIEVPFTEIGGIGVVEGIGALGGEPLDAPESLPRTTIFRPGDLLRVEFRFVNLDRVDADGMPTLARRDAAKPAFLIAVFGPQHILEQAFFDPSGPPGAFATTTKPPRDDEKRADANTGVEVPVYPVKARIARASRIAYRVTDERILFTTGGLLHAMRVLPLSVVPHAEGAPPIIRWHELADDLGAIATVTRRLRGVGAVAVRRSPGRRAAAFTDLTEAVRLRRTADEVEMRFGTASAVAAVTTDLRAGVELGPRLRLDLRPPVPRIPESTETALEIPWRLQLSPHSRGAFTHALGEVDHDGRVELWHSRLGNRTDAAADLDPSTPPPVDESQSAGRTVRAVWTRDFTPGKGPAQRTGAFPADEDFSKLSTLPPFRATLSVRDRMQLVHLTSNHRWDGYRPQPAAVERLMLTAPGGWLALEAHFSPPLGLSIEEWRHRATLGRDHYVKVVYQGVLLPFGHRASLVKVTERRVKSDGRATLYQRFFIVVRQPERRFLASGTKQFDNRMPLRWVRILTAETPPLSAPRALLDGAGGQIFLPEIAVADGPAPAPGQPGAGVQPFHFRFVANDIANRLIEFEGPAVFVEKTVFEGAARAAALEKANGVDTTYPLLGQRIAFAPPLDPDDTTLATERIRFDAGFDLVTSEKSVNFVLPFMRVAHAPVPAMSAFTGQTGARALTYATAYRDHGVGTGPDPTAHPGNQGGLFLQLADDAGSPIAPSGAVAMGFSSQSQKSGGFVSPSVGVTALARRVGPVGGDLAKLASNAGTFDVGGMFGLDAAKLFGILPLAELLPSSGGPLPAFVTKAVNVVVDLDGAVAEARAFLTAQAAQLNAQGAAVQQAAVALGDAGEAVADALAAVLQPPHPAQPLEALLDELALRARALVDRLRAITSAAGAAVAGAAGLAIPRPDLERVFGVLDRLADLASDAGPIAQAIQDFATGALLPERVSARLEWTTELVPWPPTGVSPPVFLPEGDKRLRLVSEVQAPLRGGTPTTLVSCSLPPFTVTLFGDTRFIAIHVMVMEFSVQPGRKTDVNVELSDGKDGRAEGIEFLGPLAFVNTLKEIIPFDGFSDPPYLDIEPSGLKAGFDLEIPDLAVGVFALTNIHVGAELSVPFIGESLEFRFFFATRENPFRLQVAFFAGGGFFAITISPKGLKVIEAAFEFGAAVEMSFVVASGSLSVMAGIYFRLEMQGDTQAVQLTGYFRARGEVDVLGLISASIELYLELSYRSVGGASKAVGKASISIEVSVCFLSFSVSVTCEKQFAGSSGDPTFLDTMGKFVDHRGVDRDPWAEYCDAFGVEAM
ncbi:hypothetical protein SAMN04487846_0795 [Microbacterium sp. cf046]|uniref:hypothetical protein n=1 Tax=Microbacterium sp. cf046 TaxID=1761803 RepID=UPI0008E249FD|nr:hypothetical protein [Microbacterium sp. cf046]SFR93401.1 hypothetical protein SAMN04487846_0795 [Microbacterium sp. cf046]